LYETFLSREKLLDAKGKKEIEQQLNALLEKELEFALNSPLPPPETADQGVYCSGDDCHKIRPKWQRPVEELLPPKSSVDPVWIVEGFGRGGTSGGARAPMHFGDVPSKVQQPVVAAVSPSKATSPRVNKPAAKTAAKKPAKKGAR
jgi:hypothetical protein